MHDFTKFTKILVLLERMVAFDYQKDNWLYILRFYLKVIKKCPFKYRENMKYHYRNYCLGLINLCKLIISKYSLIDSVKNN